jgi:hypothetical protein
LNTKSEGFQNSLRCLQHPGAILSILVLLINDHVLKQHYASWFTGKLSDFAGLFFFPFIVSAAIGLFPVFAKTPTHKVGQISFGLVTACFTLLKTVPQFNDFVSQAASFLTASPVGFIMDPTDLITLAVLIPAWKLWSLPVRVSTSRLAYVALSMGALAAAATSPLAWEVRSVTNLEYYKDGIVYAADKTMGGETSYPVAISMDGGLTWEEAIDRSNVEEKSLPITHCSHMYEKICYRLNRNGRLQLFNGDNEWVIVTGFENIKVYDLILFEWDGEEYVMVAAGEYGVIRQKLPTGSWDETSVMSADQ